jgi:hypothetical protein
VALLGPRASEKLVSRCCCGRVEKCGADKRMCSVRGAVIELMHALRAGQGNDSLVTVDPPSVRLPLYFIADALSSGWSSFVKDFDAQAGV